MTGIECENFYNNDKKIYIIKENKEIWYYKQYHLV